MNQAEAQAAVTKWGSALRAARESGIAKSTFADILHGKTKQARVGVKQEQGQGVTPADKNAVATFSLRNLTLLSKKPADNMKGKFYSLKKGIGYKAEDLARAWHVTEETLLRRATDHHAKAFIEATPGEFVCVIVHPETKKEM